MAAALLNLLGIRGKKKNYSIRIIMVEAAQRHPYLLLCLLVLQLPAKA